MLVLSRKKSETILIDGDISIKVLRINGNSIRLGIEAPQHVTVMRGELNPFGLISKESNTPRDHSPDIPFVCDISEV